MRLTTRTLNKNWSLASGVTTVKSERKTFTSVSIEISLILVAYLLGNES